MSAIDDSPMDTSAGDGQTGGGQTTGDAGDFAAVRDLRPGGFRYDAAEQDRLPLEAMIQILDFQDAAPSMERLRRWALELARPGAGEIAVDVGSGTGTIARRLATLVGRSGRVVGVEPQPGMRAEAVRRSPAGPAAGTASGTNGADVATVEYVDGTADALPFEDGSVDLIWCERVLQHVPDAAGCVREFARVLRPGGRLVVLDSDHASRVTSDLDRSVELRILDGFMRMMPNPMAARALPRQLRDAGLLVDPDVGSSALVWPPHVLASAPIYRMAFDLAAEAGLITAEERERESARVHAAAEDGVAFAAVTVFGFVARKPV